MSKKKKKVLIKIIIAIVILCLFGIGSINFTELGRDIIYDLTGINIDKYLNSNKIKTESPKADSKYEVSLNKCIDGDTASFNLDGEVIKVRFLGIDTPETKHPSKGEEPYGKEASEYTCKRLKNAKKIEIEYESNLARYDDYDRSLVWVYVDGTLLQEKLIEKGYAKVRYLYASYLYTDNLYKKQTSAQKSKLGIFEDYSSDCEAKETYTVTFKASKSIIDKVEVDNCSLVKIPDNPVKEGYRFVGWKKGSSLFDLSDKIDSNITLNASFKKE